MDTQIEQLNLSSITKFALAYAGITTVSELKEYNYISLANVLPRNCSLNPIMKELNTYGYIFPPSLFSMNYICEKSSRFTENRHFLQKTAQNSFRIN